MKKNEKMHKLKNLGTMKIHLGFDGVPIDEDSQKPIRCLCFAFYRVAMEIDNAGYVERSYGCNLPGLLPMK